MDYIKITGIILTFCSILINLYFRYIDKKKKKLFYNIKTSPFDNNKLITNIILFNISEKTVEYSELGKKIGIELFFPERGKIISSKIIIENNKNTDSNFSFDENIGKFSFDYFKKGNYVILEIVHISKSTIKPILKGEFIKEGEIIFYDKKYHFLRELKRITPFSLMLVSTIFLIFGIKNFEDNQIIILSLLLGYFSVDFIRFLINKPIDKQILDFLKDKDF